MQSREQRQAIRDMQFPPAKEDWHGVLDTCDELEAEVERLRQFVVKCSGCGTPLPSNRRTCNACIERAVLAVLRGR